MRAAIILAAGQARRFGGAKLAARMNGRPLLLHAIDRARGAGAGRIIVVTGARAALIARLPRGCGVRIVHARDHRAGMGESLRAGLAALRPIEREVAIFLGDMPFATMPRAMRIPAGYDAARPIVAGRPGHPLLARTAAARAARRRGDRGLAGLARVFEVAGRAGNLIDIDTIAALRRARTLAGKGSSPPRFR